MDHPKSMSSPKPTTDPSRSNPVLRQESLVPSSPLTAPDAVSLASHFSTHATFGSRTAAPSIVFMPTSSDLSFRLPDARSETPPPHRRVTRWHLMNHGMRIMALNLLPGAAWFVRDPRRRYTSARDRLLVGFPRSASSWILCRSWHMCMVGYVVPLMVVCLVAFLVSTSPCNDRVYLWLCVQSGIFASIFILSSFILLRYLRCPVWRGQDRLGQETVAESNFAEWHARLAQPPIHLWAARYWCSPFFYARILLGLFAGWAMVGAAMIASAPNVDECINCNDVVFSTAFYVIVFHCSLVGMYALMWTIIPCITLPWVLLLPEELDFGKRCASRDMVHGMPLITGSDLRRSSQQEQPGEAQHPDECSICIGEYEETERIRVLPCRHHFHADCVDQWLYVDKSCPLCKHDIDKTWPREVEMTQHGQLNTQSVSEP